MISRTVFSLVFAVVASFGAPTAAGITLTVDKDSLAEILQGMTARKSEVALSPEMRITVVIEDFAIDEIVPGNGDDDPGSIRTRMRVRSPELGLALTMRPVVRMRLEPADTGDRLALEFTGVSLALPTGALDLSSLVPRFYYPARMEYEIPGADPGSSLATQLTRVELQPGFVRFHLDVRGGEQTTIEP